MPRRGVWPASCASNWCATPGTPAWLWVPACGPRRSRSRWPAPARYGVAGVDDLGRVALSAHDVATVRQAHEFLLRVRNELHFHAGRAQDDFTLNDQVRVAAAFGYRDQPGRLPVEQFM